MIEAGCIQALVDFRDAMLGGLELRSTLLSGSLRRCGGLVDCHRDVSSAFVDGQRVQCYADDAERSMCP